MKLVGSTENEIRNGGNVPHLEIAKVVLVHCILPVIIINKIQEFYINLLQIKNSVVYENFLEKIIFF